MPKAIWNNKVIAEAPSTEVQRVEGNVYFPLASVKSEYLKASDNHSHCIWKGEANYYDVVVDGDVNKDAAWYYPDPLNLAGRIKDHVAFWHGVIVEE